MKTSAQVLFAFACCVAASGCSLKRNVAWEREVLRWAYERQLGAVHAATVVGAAAPAGGPAGLSAIVADFGTRAALANKIDESRCVPAHAAAVVGSAAPAGGMSGLSAIVADFGMRAALGEEGYYDIPQSPFVPPDPNRDCQIGPAEKVDM